jgi:hypothetical protein
MLIDEYGLPDPKDPWWMAWGDVILFGVICLAATSVALAFIWGA